jgi:hypothetical protein
MAATGYEDAEGRTLYEATDEDGKTFLTYAPPAITYREILAMYRYSDEYILATLGLTPTQYHQRLNAVLDDPVALAYDPVLVSRLRRIRDARREARA